MKTTKLAIGLAVLCGLVLVDMAEAVAPGPPGRFYAFPGNTTNLIQVSTSEVSQTSVATLGVVVVRRAGAPLAADNPVDGTIYYVGDTLAGGTVVWTNVLTGAVNNPSTYDTNLVNGTHYYYGVWAYDASRTYSSRLLVDTTPSAVFAIEGARRLYVDCHATGGNNGTSWADAFKTHELLQAKPPNYHGSEIWFAQGTYTNVCSSRRIDHVLNISQQANVKYYGGFTNGMTDLSQRNWKEYPTVLSADRGEVGKNYDNNHRVINVTASTTNILIDGFHIVDGNANNPAAGGNLSLGAGLYSACKTGMVLRNCFFFRNANTNHNGGNSYGSVVADNSSSWQGYMISNTVFAGNSSIKKPMSLMYSLSSNNIIENCLFLWNNSTSTIHFHYFSIPGVDSKVKNCTFARNNSSTEIFSFHNGAIYTTTVENCIIWSNAVLSGLTISNAAGSTCKTTVRYSDVQNSGGSASWTTKWPNVLDKGGNIDRDPQFIGTTASGTWTSGGIYDAGTDRTKLTDTGHTYPVNSLKGQYINPDTTGWSCFYIVSNSANEIVVIGDAEFVGIATKTYAVFDVHEQSSSPCIDTGNPTDLFPYEPALRDNKYRNMGAYGNTPEAAIVGGAVYFIR